MSREKSVEERRRDDIEERLMRLLNGQITTDEMGQIFDDARRYRALHCFVDNTEMGSIVADDVYTDLTQDDDAPQPPEHCSNTMDDGTTGISASYGLALDSLADFLDANRFAGRPREARDA